MKNVLYFSYINKIGGVETMFWNLAKKYSDWDITIYYKGGSEEQIARLKKYVRVVKWDGVERIKCDKLFMNYNMDIIDYVDAKEYYMVIHADYKVQNIVPHVHPKMTKYICVSETAEKSFRELTGLTNTIVCYNPLLIDENDRERKTLILLSMTRLTKEKGKHRIEALSNALFNAKVPFIWFVFTDDVLSIKGKNIYQMHPTLDVYPYMNMCDVFLNLSDSEGWCYSVNEFLSVKKPEQQIAITPCPSFYEMGINEENGLILDFDLGNIDKIVNSIKKMSINKRKDKRLFYPAEDIWNELFEKGDSTYGGEIMIKVKATKEYKERRILDAVLGKIPEENEEFLVDEERFNKLSDATKNPYKCVFVVKVEEEKVAKPRKTKKK